MNPSFKAIKSLYIPVQPTVKQSGKKVIYQEIVPHEKLQHFIYCYWQLKTTAILKEQFHYRVVADGCIDIFFELNRPSENFVMGFCKKYTEFPLENRFHYVGIRFYPSIFPQFFKINAMELSNRFEHLKLVVPLISGFIKNNFSPALSFQEIKLKLDDYFIQYLKNIKFDVDTRFYEALEIILKNFGSLETEANLNTGISPRQLRRIFNYYIGTTPKTFSKVVRFQNILKAKPSSQSLKKNKLFYDVGFYDQAHFIKDFKNFYGVTPTQAFR